MKCVKCGLPLNDALLCPPCECDENGNPWPAPVFIYAEDTDESLARNYLEMQRILREAQNH